MNWLDQYKDGGMIKRADGSYSQRGLWDNIRANAGSGKKPTKEMLKQEKKIKAAEKKEYGGWLNEYQAGGITVDKSPESIKKSVYEKYPILNKAIPIDSAFVSYPQGKDIEVMKQWGHNPEYVNPDDSYGWINKSGFKVPAGKVANGPDGDNLYPSMINVPHIGYYNTIVDTTGKNRQDIENIVANDFLSHGLHNLPEYNKQSAKLKKELVKKYGKHVEEEGGVDAYVRSLIDPKNYPTYQQEMPVDTSYTNPIKRLIGIKQSGGKISTTGYKADSPDRYNPYNIIPTGRITMQNVPHPVYGIDNYGNHQIMMPGREYQFPGQQVYETPIKPVNPENALANTATMFQKGNFSMGYDPVDNGYATVGFGIPLHKENGGYIPFMKEGGIPQRYKNMGFTHVGQKKSGDGQHKWKVLAKKGDSYKVVQGGYRGMQDFKQHHSQERRNRFWDRMGGRDSAKAKDPFSPLYWHKKFGTWEYGGPVEMQQGGFTPSQSAALKQAMLNRPASLYQDVDPAMLQQMQQMKQLSTPIGRADATYEKKKKQERITGREAAKGLQEQYARERFADDPSVVNPAYWQTDPITGRTPQQRLSDMGTDLQTRVFRGGTNWLDNLNPGVWMAGMAGNLAKAPLRAQQENSAMPYVSAIGEPVLWGAGEQLVAPYLKKIFGKAPVNYGESNVGSQAMPKIHTDLYPKDGRYLTPNVNLSFDAKLANVLERLRSKQNNRLSNLDLDEVRRVFHNSERFLTPDEHQLLRTYDVGERGNYVQPSTDYISGSYVGTPETNFSPRLQQQSTIGPVSRKVNRSGLTKEQVLEKAASKDKDAISKMTEQEFQNTVLKPTGEIVEYKPGTTIDEMTYDLTQKSMVLKNRIPMSNQDYVKTFNENLDVLNDIISQKNKSGVEYKVKELTPDGRLVFETPKQAIPLELTDKEKANIDWFNRDPKDWIINKAGLKKRGDVWKLSDEAGGNEFDSMEDAIDFIRNEIKDYLKPKEISGKSTWAVNINPGEWRGNVEDIANTEYFRSIPGLEMSNTTSGVFADNIPRKGTGAYESINQYLKQLDLGRVKPGFNSQTEFSRGAWENFIKSGRGVGFYANPSTVHGIMRTIVPPAALIGAGAAAASQADKQKYGGTIKNNWLKRYQTGGVIHPNYSIVDYLASKGQDFSKAHRADLAKEYGIENYDYSSAKNLELLSKLKNQEVISKPIARSIPIANKSITQTLQSIPYTWSPVANNTASNISINEVHHSELPAVINKLQNKGVITSIEAKKAIQKVAAPGYTFKNNSAPIEKTSFTPSFKKPADSNKQPLLIDNKKSKDFYPTPIPGIESGIIVDKETNTGYIIKNHKKVHSFPVITGKDFLDTPNMSNDPSENIRTTPAGVYDMSPNKDIYGHRGFDLINTKLAKGIANHITYDPKHRSWAYNSNNPKDRNMSYGCINGKCEDIEEEYKYFPEGGKNLMRVLPVDKYKSLQDYLQIPSQKYGGSTKKNWLQKY